MSGIHDLCRLCGAIDVRTSGGDYARYVWDYVANDAVHESEMPQGSERGQASERAKWTAIRERADAEG